VNIVETRHKVFSILGESFSFFAEQKLTTPQVLCGQ